MMTVDSISCTQRHYVIEPIYSCQNRLFAMELLTRFNDEGPCSEKRIQQMSRAEKQALLIDQLESIAQKQRYFIDNNIRLSLNIDFTMAMFLSQDGETRNLMDKLPFICLEISENFPNLNDGKRNPLLAALYERYPLWLDGFGSGNSNIYAVSQSTFYYVKLDKIFYWEMIKDRKVYTLSVLVENIQKYCHGIIIEGVQTHSEYYLLKNCGVAGIQGYIYPTYTLDTLPTLKI
ncbi:EAL domain-containing protein [Brenneria izadpanahii]|uniref:EAL domain-containing protein n=2 Tax=Brenneria izadpanahii TaxID=2722756 RepID=A0ABX7UYK1_9GAMM|nr:EAL domain-containing protein [Brenneria izadpanahii]